MPALGQVATRSFLPASGTLSTANLMTRSAHVATDAITSLQVKFPAWHVVGGGAELVNSGTTTFTASVEYPAGTFTQIKWSGSASSAVPVGNPLTTLIDTGLCDVCTVAIPKGAIFWIRNYAINATPGILGCTQSLQSTRWVAQGEASIVGGGTDLTLSGTVTDGGSGAFIYPMCVVAVTATKSFAIPGDSRTIGTGFGPPDANGNQGQFTPSLGTSYGYINMGVGSDVLSEFNRSGFQRRSLFQYCTHLVGGYLINDSVAGNRTSVQMEADLQTFWMSARPGQPIIETTVYPVTTGSWNTPGGQTVQSNYAALATVNTYLRTKPIPLSAVPDLDALLEDSANPGKWITSPSPPYTGDGVHCNTAGYSVISTSGAITGATLAALTNPAPRFTIMDFPSLAAWWDVASLASGVSTTFLPSRCSPCLLGPGTETFSATSFLGGPGMTFNGTTNQLLGDATFTRPLTNGLAGFTLAVLCQFPSLAGAGREWFGATVNGSNSERGIISFNAANELGIAFRRLDADATVQAFSSAAAVTNTTYIIVAVFDPANTGTAILRVNGVQVASGNYAATGNISATNSNNFPLCTLNSSNTALLLSECSLLVSALSLADAEKLEGEIAWRKLGSGSILPSNHPYFNGPPTS